MQLANSTSLKAKFTKECIEATVGSEWTFHQLAPYIGKIKSSIARFLIESFTKEDDTIFDPFSGAGTIPFEGWALKRNVIANDLNVYAYVLTLAKLHPPKSLDELLNKIEELEPQVQKLAKTYDLRKVPKWVRDFFHKQTLREILAWVDVLLKDKNWFLIACLLGILHHQRPGFLSFPSSHTVPYLRTKKYPISEYPDMYEYRNVKERLSKKVTRAFKRTPKLFQSISRECHNTDASTLKLSKQLDAIISSPPYMRKLDYGRDNRLRLWFLGLGDFKSLDQKISPKESDYLSMMKQCLSLWSKMLKKDGKCILFLGDNYSKKEKLTLPEIIESIAVTELGAYKLLFRHESIIPINRRVRRRYEGNKVETILVLQKITK